MLATLILRHRRTDHMAQAARLARRAADGDLIPLLAVLIHAQDADVTDVMVAAGVHAAGHLQLDFTDVIQIVVVVEMPLQLVCDR